MLCGELSTAAATKLERWINLLPDQGDHPDRLWSGWSRWTSVRSSAARIIGRDLRVMMPHIISRPIPLISLPAGWSSQSSGSYDPSGPWPTRSCPSRHKCK
jgi:hypothetical protein